MHEKLHVLESQIHLIAQKKFAALYVSILKLCYDQLWPVGGAILLENFMLSSIDLTVLTHKLRLFIPWELGNNLYLNF